MSGSNLIRGLVALILMVMPAWAEDMSVRGSVTYRERMALPPDAWLTVTLVKLPAGSPVAGASAGIPAGQVPIGFALNIHAATDKTANYGLVAEISSGGRVLFLNPVAAPVALGNATPVRIVVNYAPQPRDAPIEATMPPPPPADLIDIVWTVSSIAGTPVVEGKPLTLSIAADNRAGGSGGCNSFFTEASLNAQALSFGPAAATRMACQPAIMAQETAYFAALGAVASYELDENGLRLLDAAGIPLIGLVRSME